jgi:predicted RND superfamily exporter protein
MRRLRPRRGTAGRGRVRAPRYGGRRARRIARGSQINERYLEEGGRSDEAPAAAVSRRVRPIAMATLATAAGLLTPALGLGSGADIPPPLAVAVIGGLMASTAVTLLVVPVVVRAVAPRDLAALVPLGAFRNAKRQREQQIRITTQRTVEFR